MTTRAGNVRQELEQKLGQQLLFLRKCSFLYLLPLTTSDDAALDKMFMLSGFRILQVWRFNNLPNLETNTYIFHIHLSLFTCERSSASQWLTLARFDEQEVVGSGNILWKLTLRGHTDMKIYIAKVNYFKYEVISHLRGHWRHAEDAAKSSCLKPCSKGSNF